MGRDPTLSSPLGAALRRYSCTLHLGVLTRGVGVGCWDVDGDCEAKDLEACWESCGVQLVQYRKQPHSHKSWKSYINPPDGNFGGLDVWYWKLGVLDFRGFVIVLDIQVFWMFWLFGRSGLNPERLKMNPETLNPQQIVGEHTRCFLWLVPP